MGSMLKQFMTAATSMLNEADAKRSFENGHRVSPFVSTIWCFAEIDDALAACAKLSADIRLARLHNDLPTARRLTAELRRAAFQIHEMALTASGVFGQEEV